MIIVFTSTLFISYIFLNAIKYEIEKRNKEVNHWDLERYKRNVFFGFMFAAMFLIPFLGTLSNHIKDYNKYYFKEKNEAKLLILKNNIFSGTIIKWWTKDYPKIQ